MRDLTKQEREAIEAVAKRFSATWEKGNGSCENYLRLARKRVAVEVAVLKWGGTRAGGASKPHLRFDKVVREVMGRLQATFAETVPDGTTVLLTITAPIRLASKTTAEIEERVRTLLGRGSLGRDVRQAIHGNRVVIRILKGTSAHASKMIGFVHNRETDPRLLLDTTSKMLNVICVAASRQGDERWLVMITGRGISWLEAHRYIYSQMQMESGFKEVFVAFDDGRVEQLNQ